MIDKIKELALQNAQKLLREYEINECPVPIEKIIRKKGIILVDDIPFDDHISGFIKLRNKAGQPVIAVNSTHPVERKRFTMAHELGHFLMHTIDPVYVEENRIYFRNAKSSQSIDWKEIQANQFAAELLIPTNKIIKDLPDGFVLGSDEGNDLIESLAKKYLVSVEAMTIKIGNLIS